VPNLTEIIDAKFILWINYGMDGWTPKPMDSIEEAQTEVAYGVPCGSESVITRGALWPPVAPDQEQAQ
jgi:hypothetical protein